MSRTRASAKAAGSRFERSVADYLKAVTSELLGWPSGIDRRVKTGAKDRGDIGGVHRWTRGRDDTPIHSGAVVVECKDTSRINLAGWAAEAAIERSNDDALAGVIVHKRHGVADPARQWVTMELAEFVALLTGQRPDALVQVDVPASDVQAVSGDAGRSESVSEVLARIPDIDAGIGLDWCECGHRHDLACPDCSCTAHSVPVV